jgi:L-ascorbate metabolism protein UlaG (beta-lactamase superfamily)
MSTFLTWLGHGCWAIETEGTKLLLDPFLDDSPTAPVKSDQVEAEYILASHGHFDHVADLPKIAMRCGSTVIASYEVCQWAKAQGVAEDKLQEMNIGGEIKLPFGRVKMTLAQHSSMMPDGSHGGSAGGFLLKLPAGKIYFACDTALFWDMKLIGAGGLDLAVLPIGDRYTMGPLDSLEAIKLLNPKRVMPSHYNTWPPIAQDANAWAQSVKRHTACEAMVPYVGERIEL